MSHEHGVRSSAARFLLSGMLTTTRFFWSYMHFDCSAVTLKVLDSGFFRPQEQSTVLPDVTIPPSTVPPTSLRVQPNDVFDSAIRQCLRLWENDVLEVVKNSELYKPESYRSVLAPFFDDDDDLPSRFNDMEDGKLRDLKLGLGTGEDGGALVDESPPFLRRQRGDEEHLWPSQPSSPRSDPVPGSPRGSSSGLPPQGRARRATPRTGPREEQRSRTRGKRTNRATQSPQISSFGPKSENFIDLVSDEDELDASRSAVASPQPSGETTTRQGHQPVPSSSSGSENEIRPQVSIRVPQEHSTAAPPQP